MLAGLLFGLSLLLTASQAPSTKKAKLSQVGPTNNRPIPPVQQNAPADAKILANTVLLDESFDSGELPPGWTPDAEGEGVSEDFLYVDGSNLAGGDPYELYFYRQSATGTVRLIIPLNTVGFNKLFVTFKQYIESWYEGPKFKLQTSSDLVTWTDEAWAYQASSSEWTKGPESVTTVITHNLNSPTTYLALAVSGNLSYLYRWNIDDIIVESEKSLFDMPYTESFSVSTLPQSWTVKTEGDGVYNYWGVSNSSYAGGTEYEMYCDPQSAQGTVRLMTPPIDTTGASVAFLSFKYRFYAYEQGLTVKVQSSPDGVTWSDEAWFLESSPYTALVDAQSIVLPITHNTNNLSTYIAFVIQGDLSKFVEWYIDDVDLAAPSASYDIPFAESFETSGMPAYWTKQALGQGVADTWTISNTNYAGGDAYEAMCDYRLNDGAVGAARLVSPPIDTRGHTVLTLNFNHSFVCYGPDITYSIQTSPDGVNWTNEFSFDSSEGGNSGPAQIDIANNLNIETTFIAFTISGNFDLQGQWYIDDIILTPSGAGPGVLSVSPVDGFSSSGFAGGPFSPISKEYVLENTGETSLHWSVGGTQTWTTPDPATGSLGPGETAVVTVSLNGNANLLAAGPYIGSVTFTNTSNGNGNTTRPVNFTVIPLPNITVSPANRDVAYTAGSTTFGVTNTGGGTLTWTAAVMAGSNWVTIQSGASGTNAGTITVAFTANTWTLPRTGTIIVTAAGATSSPTYVTVTQAAAPGFSVLLDESFGSYEFPPPGWTRHVEGEGSEGSWSLSGGTDYAGGQVPEARCHYQYGTGVVRLVAQIDTIGYSKLYLSFKHRLESVFQGAVFKIQTSPDLATWTDEGWVFQPPDGYTMMGPETLKTVLSHNLNRPTTYVAFVVSGNLYAFEDWFIDDVKIESAASAWTIPFTESFSNPNLPLNWTVRTEGEGILNKWIVSDSSNAGGASYEMDCQWQSGTGLTRLVTPPIDTTGYSALYLAFKSGLDVWGGDLNFKIQTSSDGVIWTDEAWALQAPDSNSDGPATITTTLTRNLNSPCTYVAFVIAGDFYQYNDWFIDDVSISAPETFSRIPVSESFDDTAVPLYWTTQQYGAKVPNLWSISPSSNLGRTPNELYCNMPTFYPAPGTVRFVSPAINTVGVSDLALSFWHQVNLWGSDIVCKVQTSPNALDWTDEEWSMDSTGYYGFPEFVNFRLTHNLGLETTFVAFTITGDLGNQGGWFLDDIVIGPYSGPKGILEVSPETGLASSGPVGGPFSSAFEYYYLFNSGDAPLNWTATKTQNWLTLSSGGGSLDPYEGTTVMVLINSLANSLPTNVYTDTVTFTNTTPGGEVIGRPVSLTVSPLPSVDLEVISPDGGENWVAGSRRYITWTQTGLSGSVTIDLYQGGQYRKNLGTALASAGTFTWDIAAAEAPGNDYRVRIWQGGYSDSSAANFSITSIVRVDFDKDGREDVLWRYHGAGGQNRVWFLGNAAQASSMPLEAASSLGKAPSKEATATKMSPRAIANSLRELGLSSPKRSRSHAKMSSDLMGTVARRTIGVTSIADPLQAGGRLSTPDALPQPVRTSDPRLVMRVAGPNANDVTGSELAALPQFLGGADLLPVDDPNWQVRGTGDFDKDGNIDILWRNISTGVNVIWFMIGTQWSRSAELLPVQDQNWQIVGTGDFDKDGNVDILWRNSVNGWNLVWHMNGASWTRSAPIMTVTDQTWQIAGTGDFNKDGNVDILWRNTVSGADVVWYMNGTSWSSSAPLITVDNPAWQIAGTGDYNNDGNIDILWRFYGAGGVNVIWYMNGVSWIESAEIISVPDSSWKIVSR
ncbi:MAG: hypothetical protein C3F08_00385 [Candidatus Methylomirabilota bacterium]|nr:MAG: hypothetical protein C3F08_00385 [candidate division NC10 bacterium]